jgi:outer membrane protein OmpA-like peptidoglycan-associated protein
MNRLKHSGVNPRKTLIATTVASVLLAACASAPLKPDGSAEVRSKLTQLQSDPNLASRAPLAIKEADAAVRTAEQPQADQELAAHRVYLADRKVEIARAQAETRLAEDQRAALSAQREGARLDARTREADAARSQVTTARAEGAEQRLAADRQLATARAEGAEQKLAADQARSDSDAAQAAAANAAQAAAANAAQAAAANAAQAAAANAAQAAAANAAEAAAANAAQAAAANAAQAAAANAAEAAAANAAEAAAANAAAANAAQVAAASSQQQTTEMQRQIDMLQAKVTDRGLVLTLGDVLFESGRADLKTGTAGNLNKLAAFLNKYPDRSVAIEGYTDSIGSEDYNQALSQRRADSVRSYLVRQGIASARLSASGMGKNDPVAGNDSAFGRQQNRRVEVIISNPAAAVR